MPFNAGKPSVARLHDYALGGKDNFAADREMAAVLEEIFALGPVLALESRQFVARAIDYVTRQGVVQYCSPAPARWPPCRGTPATRPTSWPAPS